MGADVRQSSPENSDYGQGWLVEKRPGARGRVAVHGLDLGQMIADTRAVWPQIGSDFIERMEPKPTVATTNVVPFKTGPVSFAQGEWGAICMAFHAMDPAAYDAWIAPLVPAEAGEGVLTLAAPSRFHASYVSQNLAHRLLTAARRVDPSIRDVVVTAF